jgi:hypothetical protein
MNESSLIAISPERAMTVIKEAVENKRVQWETITLQMKV